MFKVIMSGRYHSGTEWTEISATFVALDEARLYVSYKYWELLTHERGQCGVTGSWINPDGTSWCVDLDDGEQISASIEDEELS